MHIEYLDSFYKIVIAGSISKVANSAYISQSALSQQISKLEETLGYKLLDRSNKGVELTEKGVIVFKYADSILRTYNTMLEELKDSEENIRTIKIEACWTIANYSLPCVMFKIKEHFSTYNYQLQPNKSDRVEEDVLNNICDIGVIYNKPNSSELSYHKIGMDKLVLVSSFNFKIPNEIEFIELIDYPLILLNDKSYIVNALTKKMEKQELNIDNFKILYNSSSLESVKLSVINGFGIGFLPYTSIKKELNNKQLKLIDIKDLAIDYEIYFIYNEKIKSDKVLNDFIEYFKKISPKSLC